METKLREICDELNLDDIDQLMELFDCKSEEEIVEFFRTIRSDDTGSKIKFMMCADALFGDDYTTRQDYSGRGMYGRTAESAIVVGSHSRTKVGRVFKELTSCSVDNMGLDYIYYI